MTGGLPARRRGRRTPKPADSCGQCLAWGYHGGLCRACQNYAAAHPSGQCRTCRRVVPVNDGVCRLCRKQATLIAGPDNKTRVDLTVAASTGHQLFLADLERAVRFAGGRRAVPLGPDPVPSTHTALRPVPPCWRQLALLDLPPDLRRVSSLDPPRDPRLAAAMLDRAETLAGVLGWNPRTLGQVRRGLRVIAAAHPPGEQILASTVAQLTDVGLSALRVHEVLADLGLVVEDRPDSLQTFLDRQLHHLPDQIRAEVDTWLTVLRHGDGRRTARARRTVVTKLYLILPFLTWCADQYATLRQVTRSDVTTWLAQQPVQAQPASALRSLFKTLKRRRMLFADPTRSVHTGQSVSTIPTPVDGADLATVAAAARRTPALRVVIAFAGVHALHPRDIRALLLADIDLPNRRLHHGDIDRPLDEFTAVAVTEYLAERRSRWPNTGNPHLLVTRRTAHDHEPVSAYWLTTLVRGLPITIAQLREDRLIEEAVAAGADPLHIAAMFGLSARTGVRYATAAANWPPAPPP